ncbi:beta-glucosidase family protein [Glutamicibacter endophyticus]|uniref:beta-glucosidase family protein n=1 Tax=Glutamicibacter endophyticus TaxID=1522174 RepID=UPI003AEF4405
MTVTTHNSTASLVDNYRGLLNRLELAEKVRLLTGETAFTLPGNDSIGLAEMAFSDGPTGVRGLKFYGGEAVALVPNATLIAGSWDDEIAYEVGELLSEEAARQQIHVVLGPTINLHRTPLGGRLFEAYSEDPYLTGRTAAGYVKGMQAGGTGACLKHLVANESEIMRNFMDSRLSEATLREVYLTPFEIAVQDAHPYSMMAAYNDVNGVPATEQDHVQNQIVKGEWGWDGLIMSDWFATKHTAESANGGLDLIMPQGGPWGEHLVAAVERGEVSEQTIDEHVARLLLLAERTGALDTDGRGHRSFPTDLPTASDPARAEQLKRIATRGMVVLKNEGQVLPLESGTVALSGRPATDTQLMGGGSAIVTPPYQVGIAQGLSERIGERLSVASGPWTRRRPLAVDPLRVSHPETGAPGLEVSYYAADGTLISSVHSTVPEISVGWDDEMEQIPARVTFRAKVGEQTQSLRLGGIGAGNWTVEYLGSDGAPGRLGSQSDFVTDDPGEAVLRPPAFEQVVEVAPGSVVSASVELQDSERTNRLLEDPRFNIVPESHMAGFSSFGKFALVATPIHASDEQLIAEAAQQAAAAETAVVVVGLTEEDETEAADKQTLALPGAQDALVSAVAAVAPRTVVVLNAATPVLMPWLDEVDAVLVVGLPGQEGGHAVAEVLTGVAEPTGRLVTSYPSADGAAPAWGTEPDEQLRLDYTDGSFIGYRGYAAGHAAEPLFYFGHGLGYGQWQYTAATLDEEAVQVELTNTGTRTSRETVQLYFRPDDQSQPVRLVGYQGVVVAAGESASVRVRIDQRMLRRWDETAGHFEPVGQGSYLVARSLADIRAELRR